jgi:hypothetical protein
LCLDKFQSEVLHVRFVPFDLTSLPDPLVPFWQCKCVALDPHLFDFINKAGIRNDFVEFLQGLRFSQATFYREIPELAMKRRS